jgi:hypothetical protein
MLTKGELALHLGLPASEADELFAETEEDMSEVTAGLCL